MTPRPGNVPPLTRRSFLVGAASLAALAACDSGGAGSSSAGPGASTPGSAAVGAPSSPASAPPPVSGPARFVAAGPATGSQVALTFHTDGDLALVDQLLAILDERDVPITAFIVGKWLEANPSYADRLVDGGHELANHTYSHPDFDTLDFDAMTVEVVRCRDVIARLTGNGGSCFRPSGTADGTSTPAQPVLDVAGSAGYPVVLGFNVDPYDYQDPGADAVRSRTVAALAPGAIVSLHFGHIGTITALPAILDGLEARSLEPVHVSTLLQLP
jgi:peptidoglycan/xylan/chitin deacetylase (PgdA/CDA1 family)